MKKPVGKRMIDSLQELAETLKEDDKPVSERFNCMTVVLSSRRGAHNPKREKDSRDVQG